jgi:hypothetical protein
MSEDPQVAARTTLAATALEVLRECRRHALRCRQCRFDPLFCPTADQYLDNFEDAYRRWDTAAAASRI